MKQPSAVPSLQLKADWYRATYLLAITNLDAALVQRTSLEPARELALELAAAVESVLVEKRPPKSREALVTFLKRVEPVVLLTLAGLLRRTGATGPTPPGAPSRSDLLQAVTSRTVVAGQVLAYIETLPVDGRARYNLACYYAGVGNDEGKADPTVTPQSYALALRELADAIQAAPPDLGRRAQVDPTLEGLRQHPETAARFREIVMGGDRPRDFHELVKAAMEAALKTTKGAVLTEHPRVWIGGKAASANFLVEREHGRVAIDELPKLKLDPDEARSLIANLQTRAYALRADDSFMVTPDDAAIPPSLEFAWAIVPLRQVGDRLKRRGISTSFE